MQHCTVCILTQGKDLAECSNVTAGNGNGNGNNNAVITIQNDPTFLTCPPCEQRLPLPDSWV